MPPDPAVSASPRTDLDLRLRQQDLAGRFGLFALGQEELQPVLDEACRVAAEGLGARLAEALRFDPDRGDFLVVAGVGWRPGVIGHARVGGDGGSPAGPAVETGAPTLSNDLGHERRFRIPPVLAEHGVLNALNVPVPAPPARSATGCPADGSPGGDGGGVPFWGVLEVDCTGRDAFTGSDTGFVRSLAATVGACVEREARRAELRRLAAEREAERDLLVQEMHHRVKNSLQLVHSLLAMQAQACKTPEVRDRLLEAAQRVMTIGAVHERLYRGGSVEEADAAAYLRGLVGDLRRSMSDAAAGRTVELDVPPMLLPADRLTPLGLIATELATNALKYGRGRVLLAVRPSPGGGVEVACEDEGPGFPDGFDPPRSRGLGMRLIAALAKGADPIRVDRAARGARLAVVVAPV